MLGGYVETELELHCQNGHEWAVSGYCELGACFAHDSRDYYCPVCGQEAE